MVTRSDLPELASKQLVRHDVGFCDSGSLIQFSRHALTELGQRQRARSDVTTPCNRNFY